MSTESMRFDVESDKIGPCRNAEEYAIEWLEKRGGPVSPAELAEEYDCTPGHMQDALRDSEEIARVEIGEYVLATEIDTESTATVNAVESADMALFAQASGGMDGDADGSPQNHEDQSDDVPEAGTEGDHMVSEQELQQQRGLATEPVEKGEETNGFSERLREQRERAFGSDDQPDQEVEQSAVEEEIGIPLKVAVGAVAVFGVIVLASIHFNNQSDQPVREQPRQESGDSNRGLVP